MGLGWASVRWAMLASALGFAFQAAPAKAECKMVKVAEIAIKMSGRAPLMAAEINGKPTYLLADTGAESSTMFGSALSGLALTPTVLAGTKFYGVGGGVQAYVVGINSLKLGGMETRNRDFLVLGQASHGSGEVVGTLGEDFFSLADVEFDLAHNAIRFFRPKDCKGDEVLYWGGAYSTLPMMAGNENQISVEVMLNGHPQHALMDTGASASVVTTRAAYGVGVSVADDDPKHAFTGIGHSRVGYGVGTFKSFGFDQEAVKDVKISVADLFKYNKGARLGSRLAEDVIDNPDMLLGADFFLAHRVLVSHSQRRVYVTYTGGPLFAVDTAEAEPAK
jgi:predicted aspartyl protease